MRFSVVIVWASKIDGAIWKPTFYETIKIQLFHVKQLNQLCTLAFAFS
ncbi:hypothetical protein HNR65_000250 [Desulfosalsimonas propionicica]|uniref:Uncharacterized protein n=1 Tax=Desulfosalsimonas propionicica TaxID=332175 RepID=A0A7W0C665_9BACT|nr:hypothetical protein [Desulfosalsimonas propionicica]